MDTDFDLLDSFLKDSEPVKVEEIVPIEHPVILQNSWTAHHSKFTRNLSANKNIFNEVQNLGLPENVIERANLIYQLVCSGRNASGKGRLGIICACIYYAYNDIEPDSISYGETISIFRIEKKTALKGFKIVNNINLCQMTCFTATPQAFIRLYLKKLGVDETQINTVSSEYEVNEDRILFDNHPRPQSLAAAYVWFWLKDHHTGKIDLPYLAVLTGVSQLTIESFEKKIRQKLNID